MVPDPAPEYLERTHQGRREQRHPDDAEEVEHRAGTLATAPCTTEGCPVRCEEDVKHGLPV